MMAVIDSFLFKNKLTVRESSQAFSNKTSHFIIMKILQYKKFGRYYVVDFYARPTAEMEKIVRL